MRQCLAARSYHCLLVFALHARGAPHLVWSLEFGVWSLKFEPPGSWAPGLMGKKKKRVTLVPRAKAPPARTTAAAGPTAAVEAPPPAEAQGDGFFVCARSVCRGLWIFILQQMRESDPKTPTEVIQKQAIDVVTVVFQMALSIRVHCGPNPGTLEPLFYFIRAKFASAHLWPEPWKNIVSNVLVARMCDDKKGACAAIFSADSRMVAHLCAPRHRKCCRLPPPALDFMSERVLPWLLLVKLRKARMEENWARACDLEDDLDDSAVPETMKMFSIWLAKALAADFQTSDIGLGLRERTISPPVK